MFYLVNVDTHSFHQAKPGSKLEANLSLKKAKVVKIKNDIYKVFTEQKDAKTYLDMQMLFGGQH